MVNACVYIYVICMLGYMCTCTHIHVKPRAWFSIYVFSNCIPHYDFTLCIFVCVVMHDCMYVDTHVHGAAHVGRGQRLTSGILIALFSEAGLFTETGACQFG